MGLQQGLKARRTYEVTYAEKCVKQLHTVCLVYVCVWIGKPIGTQRCMPQFITRLVKPLAQLPYCSPAGIGVGLCGRQQDVCL